jgi:hypothetical protein
MARKTACLGILGLIALCVGCTMCCHPYDYNGPVYDNSGQCLSNERAGSILEGGGMEPAPVAGVKKSSEEPSPNVRQGVSKAGEYEGAKQLLSVTDRKVGESETAEKTRATDAQPGPILAQPAPAMLR